MQICILTNLLNDKLALGLGHWVLGILLAGQISDSSETRYSVLPPAAPANGAAVETDRPPATLPPASVPPATSAPAQLTKVTRPAELLRSLAKPVGKETLAGGPLSLTEAVQNARSRDEQTRRVKLYWQLSQAVTDFQLISLEELELQSLGNGLGQVGPAWGPARQAVAARKQVARSAVQVAQLCLSKKMDLHKKMEFSKERQRVGESNLLPSDLPHCGAYQTKYEQIFQGRTSREAQQLGQLLTLRHRELGQQAMNTTAARQWLFLVSQQRSAQSDGSELLKAYQTLALRRQAFVAAAYQYNANIARYTELAVPQEVGSRRLVAMLIQSEGNRVWQPGAIQRAAAEEEVPQQRADRYPQSTFAQPGRSETRRVPASEENGEHSILVSP